MNLKDTNTQLYTNSNDNNNNQNLNNQQGITCNKSQDDPKQIILLSDGEDNNNIALNMDLYIDTSEDVWSRKLKHLDSSLLNESDHDDCLSMIDDSDDELKSFLSLKTSLSSPTSKTRATNALVNLSRERFEYLKTTKSMYSPSTLKKHSWVKPMYEGFCAFWNLDPWPIKEDISASFTRWLGLDVGYAINSIEDVIIPCLKRINEEQTGERLSKQVDLFISRALKDVKRHKKKDQVSQGKEPAITVDVRHIIESTPDGLPSKSAEASLWLCALSTGARGITCSNILLQDIINATLLIDQKMLIVQFKYRITKGTENWNHIVTLEGNPYLKETLNFAYWFRLHLKENFDLDVLEYQLWKLSQAQKEKKIWHWSCDSMRELFKSRARFAGFPDGMLSFHSLRSGFLCSALIKAGSSKDAVTGVLENTAFVAGWIPGRNAQLRYVKTCAKKTIVSTRLIMDNNEENEARSIVEKELTTSEGFHNISRLIPCWNEDINYKSFHALVEKR